MMEDIVDGRPVDIVLAFQRHQAGGRHAEIRLRHHLDTRIDKRSLLEDMLPDHKEASKPCPLIKVEEIELRLKQQAMDTDLEFTGAKMHVITDRFVLVKLVQTVGHNSIRHRRNCPCLIWAKKYPQRTAGIL